MLDHVFDTPRDGRFTIACEVQSADARVGPVGSLPPVLIGIAAAAFLGLGGLIAGSVWLARRPAARRPLSSSTQPEAGRRSLTQARFRVDAAAASLCRVQDLCEGTLVLVPDVIT